LIQKTPLATVKRWGYNVPSDTSDEFRYGVKSKPTEKMRDILSNNFQREWVDGQKHREIR